MKYEISDNEANTLILNETNFHKIYRRNITLMLKHLSYLKIRHSLQLKINEKAYGKFSYDKHKFGCRSRYWLLRHQRKKFSVVVPLKK